MRDNRIEIIPTCVPNDLADLSSKVDVIRPFAGDIHIDITDGVFAPKCTWPYQAKGNFSPFDLSVAEGLQAEIHLMVQAPRDIGLAFARAGAHRILGHVEAFDDQESVHAALAAWKHAGAKEVGLGVLMQTPFEMLEHHLFIVNVIHLMTIARIGTQGIPYEASAPQRVRAFHRLHPDMLIGVDGGVSEKNIRELARAGARRFGVGSAISRAQDPAAAYAALKSLASAALT